ncbi:tryptophan synthase subunit alpha [Vallitalea okinawensis]|uniref:tryptophan synthase subunit alpha n=1 Tax=Vallitalea okinawensis TaxID=2078660 RepID=UPI0013004A73|nr:tryptophan synthase subunit alpha [Vallitalea okinawensis]
MIRIENAFKKAELENRKAFIPFITAGDPSLMKTIDLVKAMISGGADIVEIGIPYSDPLADGVILQEAAKRALDAGTKVNDIFRVISKLRQDTEIPIVFLVYFNTIFQYGIQNFMEQCQRVGIDGLIIPDVPFEESDEIYPIMIAHDIAPIPLVTPTSINRVEEILQSGKGYIYCVSSLGVTGKRKKFSESALTFIQEVKARAPIPVAVGFGIQSPATASFFKPFVDGVIVGSAIVDYIHQVDGRVELVEAYIHQFVQELYE